MRKNSSIASHENVRKSTNSWPIHLNIFCILSWICTQHNVDEELFLITYHIILIVPFTLRITLYINVTVSADSVQQPNCDQQNSFLRYLLHFRKVQSRPAYAIWACFQLVWGFDSRSRETWYASEIRIVPLNSAPKMRLKTCRICRTV